jgi:hypothetical protein
MHGIGTARERTTRVYMEDCACLNRASKVTGGHRHDAS